MSGRKLKRLKIDPLIADRLEAKSILTARDLLECPVLTLMNIADISYINALGLLNDVSCKIIRPQSALSLEKKSQSSNGLIPCGALGNFSQRMGGGYVRGTISEICGPPGVGKTQLCFGCCADVLLSLQLSPDATIQSGGVVFFDTEWKFSSQRLQEVLKARFKARNTSVDSSVAESIVDSLLGRVFLRRPSTYKELLDDLSQLKGFLIKERISLVVIDSIAALTRGEGATRRDEEIIVLQQAHILESLAQSCFCSVLVTNQIVQITHKEKWLHEEMGDSIPDSSGIIRPTLGVAWHHQISARIVLYRQKPCISEEDALEATEDCIMSLKKSPIAMNFSMKYKITSSGLECL